MIVQDLCTRFGRNQYSSIDSVRSATASLLACKAPAGSPTKIQISHLIHPLRIQHSRPAPINSACLQNSVSAATSAKPFLPSLQAAGPPKRQRNRPTVLNIRSLRLTYLVNASVDSTTWLHLRPCVLASSDQWESISGKAGLFLLLLTPSRI